MTLKVFILVLCAVVTFTKGAKILGVFPLPSRSHYFLGSALMKGLAQKGHDITLVSAFGEKNIPKEWKYRDIVTGALSQSTQIQSPNDMFKRSGMHPLLSMLHFNQIGSKLTTSILSDPNVQKLLNSNEKFDVVIVEQFLDDALKGIAYHFNAPLILFSANGANTWINNLAANPSPPSYISDILLSYTSEMTFIERLKNSLFSLVHQLNLHLYFYPSQNKILKQFFPNAPDLSVLNYNASLILINSHISLSQPVPLQPSMIEIGGFHLQPPKKLPEDIQKFLDDAKDGVIYFSMGSNLKSKDMPAEKLQGILNNFRKLKQKVLWKWEDDTLPNQPPNVKLGKWLPQQDILAHPNVKLFITHGGLLSTTESVWHGVPLLAIPVFGDQEYNSGQAKDNGYGLVVKFHELNEENLFNALNEILTNPQYDENAKLRSKILHDRVVKPMDLATYWVEYVIRHNGAPHLKSAALKLTWYQYHLLDVLFVVLVFLVANYVKIIVFKKYFSKFLSKFFAKKTTKKVKTN